MGFEQNLAFLGGTPKFNFFQFGKKCKGIAYFYVESTIFDRFTSYDMNFEAVIIAEIVFFNRIGLLRIYSKCDGKQFEIS